MTLSLARVRFRALAALLLAAACLQALPAKAVGFERRHGSAFDISAVEVSTAPFQRKAEQGEARPIEPPEPIVNSADAVFTKLVRSDMCPSPITTASM